eukprot:scaffold7384_cov396-Prasinococcus_capsulatus_cf.AAC.6
MAHWMAPSVDRCTHRGPFAAHGPGPRARPGADAAQLGSSAPVRLAAAARAGAEAPSPRPRRPRPRRLRRERGPCAHAQLCSAARDTALQQRARRSGGKRGRKRGQRGQLEN